MRKEYLARFVILLLAATAVTAPLVGAWLQSDKIVVHARMAELGGWTPASLTAQAGIPLLLHLTSDDVLHSFAIGHSDQPAVDVIPGEITQVTLMFEKPGRYTYYCTRWCGANHWRMRGTIEVTGSEKPSEGANPPVYVRLGLDIDAEHRTQLVPVRRPSALRGAQLGVSIPVEYHSLEYYLAHSPAELWQTLREASDFSGLTDQDLWDLVALIWRSQTTPQGLMVGQELYTTHCSACHGETGAGDGVFADELGLPEGDAHAEMQLGEMTQRPTDFTEAEHMLAASPAHLQGKILRGGMGTGMPYWGPILTDEQTWALVAYLWTFQFDLEEQP